MITKFGKELRKLRIEYDLTMRAMAEKLKVSASYISGIENGKFSVTEKFLKSLFESFQFDQAKTEMFKQFAQNNQQQVNTQAFVSSLYRSSLSEEELKKIQNQINEAINNIIKTEQSK